VTAVNTVAIAPPAIMNTSDEDNARISFFLRSFSAGIMYCSIKLAQSERQGPFWASPCLDGDADDVCNPAVRLRSRRLNG